jgi:hypothetical protein
MNAALEGFKKRSHPSTPCSTAGNSPEKGSGPECSDKRMDASGAGGAGTDVPLGGALAQTPSGGALSACASATAGVCEITLNMLRCVELCRAYLADLLQVLDPTQVRKKCEKNVQSDVVVSRLQSCR